MMNSAATIFAADLLVRFLNVPVRDARELEWPFEAMFGRVEPAPFETHTTDHYEALRQQLRKVLTNYDRDDAARIEAIRRFVLGRKSRTILVHGQIGLNKSGNPRLDNPRFESVDDIITVVLAELLADDAPAAVVNCAFRGCDQFFLRQRGPGARGQPKQFCTARCKKQNHIAETSK